MQKAEAPSRRRSPPPLHRRIRSQLRTVFGLRELRPGQHDVIDRALRGLNTLAVMPTGAGKSLCYQLPATLLPGVTVVVSPLIALMQDQCDKLRALGVEAIQLNSALAAEALREAEEVLDRGQARIVFTTPERLAQPEFQETLKRQRLALLVVDEAHCISQWGHDFRPAFTEIGTALPALGSPPVLALTATANEDVMADIAKQLRIPAAGVLTGSCYRPNLQFSVEPLADEPAKLRRVVEIMSAAPGPAIVYAATVKAAQGVHAALTGAGLAASLYHGRLTAAQRQESQQAFMSGATNAMVATNAFGLGIDKPDIRLVLHYQMPAGLDVYYQEAGRAGRDGQDARCVLLFLSSDRAVQQFFLNGRYPSREDGEAVLSTLDRGDAGASWTLEALKEKLQRPVSKLRVLLNLLRREGHLQVDEEGRISRVEKRGESDLGDLLERYVAKSQQDQARLEQVVAYAQTGGCRWRTLLEAFEEAPPFDGGRCLRCDNCLRMLAHERQGDPILVSADDAELAPRAAARPRFNQGDTVRVRRYGSGTVVQADSQSVTVTFPSAKEQRCFHPDFVTLKRPSPTAGVS